MSRPKFDALAPAGFLVFEWEMLSDAPSGTSNYHPRELISSANKFLDSRGSLGDAMRGLDTDQLCVYSTT